MIVVRGCAGRSTSDCMALVRFVTTRQACGIVRWGAANHFFDCQLHWAVAARAAEFRGCHSVNSGGSGFADYIRRGANPFKDCGDLAYIFRIGKVIAWLVYGLIMAEVKSAADLAAERAVAVVMSGEVKSAPNAYKVLP